MSSPRASRPSTTRPRPRHWLTAALAVLGATSIGPVPNVGAVAVARSITLPDSLGGVQARPGGGLELTGVSVFRRRLTLARSSWSGRGRIPHPIQRVVRLPPDLDDIATVSTRSGPLAAIGVRQNRKRRILAASFDRDGRRVGSQIIATGGRSVGEPAVVAGGDAAAITFLARDRQAERHPGFWLAFRSAGERRFDRARLVEAPDEAYDFSYTTAIGPSGDGAIVAAPVLGGGSANLPTRVRRIDRKGVLGPWIRIDEPFSTDVIATVAVTEDGTVAVGILAEAGGSPTVAPTNYLISTTLRPGTNTLTAVQILLQERNVDPVIVDDLDLSVNDQGQALLVAFARLPAPHLAFFAGPAAQLAPAGEAPLDISPFQVPTVVGAVHNDGSATAAWSAIDRNDRATPVYAAHRSPGGTFGAANVIARPPSKSRVAKPQPEAIVPMNDGRAAVTVSQLAFGRFATRLLLLAP